MKYIKVIYAILMVLLLGFISCTNSPENVNAMVIITGRHANANTFHEVSYEYVEKYLEGTVYGGYIGIISSEGTPRVFNGGRFDYFRASARNKQEQKKRISMYNSLVLNCLRADTNRAITPENDLLKAIQLASKELKVFEEQAKQNGKRIGEKRIIIMDAGIVTAGLLDFSKHDIEHFDFSVSDEKVKEFVSKIAEKLSVARELPNLEGVNIEFIGLGDVAAPQKELSAHIQNGLEILWTAILNKANAKSISILPYTSTKKANKEDFPKVKPIEFFDNGWAIGNEQVNFNFGQCIYKNPSEAENNLKYYADIIIRYINKKTDAKIYIVGSESKEQDRQYTTVLSECRAKTVMETLAKFNVPKDKMEAFGLAVYLPRRENDRPNNVFDRIIGEKNQKVVVIPSDIENKTFLNEVLAVRDKLYKK